MTPVSIGMIGAGWFGRKHVEVMRREPACRLAAIADPAPEARAYAQSAGVPCFERYEEMLDRVKPRAAIIAAPNLLHAPAGMACAERGIPMLVEKPIADTVESAMPLIAAAERAGVALLVGHHRRYNPIIAKAREIVRAGALGRITAVSAQWMLLKADEYFSAAHRRLPGAGPILTNAVHDIDDLRFICGEIASVQAMTSHAVRQYPVEDTAVIVFRFAGGALGTLTVSDTAAAPWSWELTSGENPFYPRNDENCYLISGTEGALAVPRLELWRYREQAEKGWTQPLSRERLSVEAGDPLARQIRHFCAVARGEAEPAVTGRDAARSLRVVQAVLEAAKTGYTFEIDAEREIGESCSCLSL
ncbi:MAG: Gfo/Idh/MocA family oxidoreductase [Candidatus Accumulibacter sp.]|jgi:predicted dehydrogenase|nr:Gfo/Idh/MocA family oxidoreductase [Accumulibacter sp.]